MITELILALAGLAASSQSAAAPDSDFDRTILPILSDNCFFCHGPDAKRRKADLRLDEEASAKKKNAEGIAAIVPGDLAKSELVRRVTSADREEMMPPPKSNKKLSAAQIEALRKWIASGAKWGEHWAFAPLRKPEVPPGAAHPIDAFTLARLRTLGLKPSPEADRSTLLRRVTLDLTGLPPTPEEAAAFLGDPDPAAYEKAVDRLLQSPRYGERMAWDWMEAARYADSNGYQGDGERTMWPWRDWVVRAFNDNLPYDQFTLWQLAGDLLPGASRDQKLATGFCRNHPINGEGGRIAEENRIEYVMDMTETLGTVWLGLTLTCSRCHDHKFDPILKKEYYSLFAFFNQTPVNGGGGDPQTAPVIEIASEAETGKLAQLEGEVAQAGKAVKEIEGLPVPDEIDQSPKLREILKTPAEKRSRQQLDDLKQAIEPLLPKYASLLRALRDVADRRSAARKAITRVMVMEDMDKPRKTYALDKGLYDKHQDEVTAGVPGKLPPFPGEAPRNRLGLARWLVSAENPLPARVTVNRLWQMLFGIGLTKTAEDFGHQGEYPVHRDLLNWLAADFRDSGWDVKRLLRQILTSRAYRQSSRVSPELLETDPQNRLIARGPRFRMPSWMIRDQALAAAGLLSGTIGGPPVRPYQPPGVWEEATFGGKTYKQDHGEALYRRSLYVFWRRIIGPTLFFDTQSRATCCVKPTRTNTPLHALATLNDPTYVEAARVLAEKALGEPGGDPARLGLAFQRVLGRAPREAERRVLLSGLERRMKEFAPHPEDAKKLVHVGETKRDESIDPVLHAAWTSVCLAILNCDEAVTRE